MAEALRDPFFLDAANNGQCQRDIRDLEEKIGRAWITPLLNVLQTSQESFEETTDNNNII